MDKKLKYYLNWNNLDSDNSSIKLIGKEIGGGRTSRETIDILSESPEYSSIRISGLDQKTFEYFISRYGQQFEHITLWKCPKIQDLSPLNDLVKLKYLIIYWIQKAPKFWNVSNNKSLVGLSFNDCLRLTDFTLLGESKTILELMFGDAVWPKLKLESLQPIGNMTQLELLDFNAKQIIDNDITPIAKLQKLKELHFPLKMFSTEQVAWLKAKLPSNILSRSLIPFYKFTDNFEKDTIITGKGKPLLRSKFDQEKINRYAVNFENLVKKYSLDK